MSCVLAIKRADMQNSQDPWRRWCFFCGRLRKPAHAQTKLGAAINKLLKAGARKNQPDADEPMAGAVRVETAPTGPCGPVTPLRIPSLTIPCCGRRRIKTHPPSAIHHSAAQR